MNMTPSIILSAFVAATALTPLALAETTAEGSGDMCKTWNPVGGGLNSSGLSLTVFEGDLIVGGTFTGAGGLAANRIARWDGATWHPLGNGMNQSVDALTVYNGDLIAGGWFTTAGGVSASRIARWTFLPSVSPEDGSGGEFAWLPLGSGMAAGPAATYVSALTVFAGQLIAGGQFQIAGGVSANFIARFNGSSWHPLGGGTNGTVQVLTTHNGDLIAGGFFTVAGGQTALRIARWNGSSWQPIGGGMNAQVLALTTYNGNLIAGGVFTTAGGEQVNSIARWNETSQSWEPLGGGMSGGFPTTVRALTVYNGDVIAGGAFTEVDGIPANGIARWNDDTRQWLPLADTFNVNALMLFDDELIAAGGFNPAGSPNFIGRWRDCSVSQCLGDLNGDGIVDAKDLWLLLKESGWGRCPASGDCPGDLNGDGHIGVADLLILLASWGMCCDPGMCPRDPRGDSSWLRGHSPANWHEIDRSDGVGHAAEARLEL